jgi:hypothetical protein
MKKEWEKKMRKLCIVSSPGYTGCQKAMKKVVPSGGFWVLVIALVPVVLDSLLMINFFRYTKAEKG